MTSADRGRAHAAAGVLETPHDRTELFDLAREGVLHARIVGAHEIAIELREATLEMGDEKAELLFRELNGCHTVS